MACGRDRAVVFHHRCRFRRCGCWRRNDDDMARYHDRDQLAASGKGDPEELLDIIRASQVSTFASMLSLLFALLGGLIVSLAVAADR